jgi:hypothetical protein
MRNEHLGEMLVPQIWRGPALDIPFAEYQWIKSIPGRVWCGLFEKMPSKANNFLHLPDNYDIYIISFHLEPIDLEWIDEVSKTLHAPLIILVDAFDIDYPVKNNVFIMSYIYWHRQLELGMTWFPKSANLVKTKKYMASAVCNRITQSKLLITTALLEEFGDSCLIALNNLIEEKNVHFRQSTGNVVLDNLSKIFWQKYQGKKIAIDDFESATQNYQRNTINPWIPLLQDTVLHFTNETLAYSFMQTDHKKFIYPGPFLTEKTLKCLLGGTAFIPVGQYNTYGALNRLGLNFAYTFDISWDQDPGNLSRLESIIQLIQWLKNYTPHEIFDMVKDSTNYNYDLVWSGDFSRNCQTHNADTVDKILSKLG